MEGERKFYCNVCEVHMNSESTYELHIGGQKHKRVMEQKPWAHFVPNSKAPDAKGSDFYCSVCEITLNSQATYDTHVAGARHEQNIANREAGLPLARAKNTPKTKTTDPNMKLDRYCSVCETTMNGENSYQQHMVGARHLQNVELRKSGEPILDRAKVVSAKRDEWDKPLDPNLKPNDPSHGIKDRPLKFKGLAALTSEPLIGLQYVTEYQVYDDSQPARYECRLCGCSLALKTSVMHIAGFKHRARYLKLHHDEHYKKIKDAEREEWGEICKNAIAEIFPNIKGQQQVILKLEPAKPAATQAKQGRTYNVPTANSTPAARGRGAQQGQKTSPFGRGRGAQKDGQSPSFGRGRGQGNNAFGRGAQGNSTFGRGGQGNSTFGRGSQGNSTFGRGNSAFGRGAQGNSTFGRGSQGNSAFGRGGKMNQGAGGQGFGRGRGKQNFNDYSFGSQNQQYDSYNQKSLEAKMEEKMQRMSEEHMKKLETAFMMKMMAMGGSQGNTGNAMSDFRRINSDLQKDDIPFYAVLTSFDKHIDKLVISTEDEASVATSVSNALTQAVLSYRIQKVKKSEMAQSSQFGMDYSSPQPRKRKMEDSQSYNLSQKRPSYPSARHLQDQSVQDFDNGQYTYSGGYADDGMYSSWGDGQ